MIEVAENLRHRASVVAHFLEGVPVHPDEPAVEDEELRTSVESGEALGVGLRRWRSVT